MLLLNEFILKMPSSMMLFKTRSCSKFFIRISTFLPREKWMECPVAATSWSGFGESVLAIAVAAQANASTRDSFGCYWRPPVNIGALGCWLSLSCTPDTTALAQCLYWGPHHLLSCFSLNFWNRLSSSFWSFTFFVRVCLYLCSFSASSCVAVHHRNQ